MCNSLLFLALLLLVLGPFHNVMDMVRLVKGRKERVLNQIFSENLGYTLTFVLVFLMFSEPCFWGLIQNWVVVSKGVLLGIPVGLMLGIIGVKFSLVPRIKNGALRGINRGGYLIGLTRFCVVGVFLFLGVMDSSNSILCQVFDIRGESLCLNLFQGILIGYFLGILCLECGWVWWWEIQNHRILYIEEKEETSIG